ncbi:hypothetical protein PPL_00155 [Heterostelium album PN500]|uniref:Uncharacterized protein n=1 Tax=Heterostelium pallidum (strain ATCC 26659 / Pp 5 / PN500) TaxID=670386 RepID=D3AVP0_HETP5|nr:hypothetical protein PPL_00155 [Heterostelium album PN500]EFA86363.1 hypothetical protein PPL_00155 [Heterostelium album PN500]|eukprot:XP_020438468.1 hypothetical protein PPL_00155 [Heterostelium album PN500]
MIVLSNCLSLVGCSKHIATLVSQIETRKRVSQSTKVNNNTVDEYAKFQDIMKRIESGDTLLNNNNNNDMEVVEQYQYDFSEPNMTNFNSDGKWPYIADSILKKRFELDVFNRAIRYTFEANRIKTIEFDRASLKGVVFGHVEIELMQHRPEYKVEIEFSDHHTYK